MLKVRVAQWNSYKNCWKATNWSDGKTYKVKRIKKETITIAKRQRAQEIISAIIRSMSTVYKVTEEDKYRQIITEFMDIRTQFWTANNMKKSSHMKNCKISNK